jgi:hypothetical protein
MKAIQIRFISATNFKGARVKVWAEGVKPLIESRDYSIDHDLQARGIAERYIQSLDWGYTFNGFGMLPNGDYCATLGN